MRSAEDDYNSLLQTLVNADSRGRTFLRLWYELLGYLIEMRVLGREDERGSRNPDMLILNVVIVYDLYCNNISWRASDI